VRVQQEETLGIVPMFWKDERPMAPEILPVRRLGE
jgi:hypothetical protein